MEYCKYHPLTPATYHCSFCKAGLCDCCVNETTDQPQCLCGGHWLTSLGARYKAVPFWRRLRESFHYPLNIETGILIVVCALFSAVTPYLPFQIIWFLMILGFFMKYCFSCLENTASGDLAAPDITAAYGGGITLALHLVGMMLIIGASVFAAFTWLGFGIGMLVTIFYLCSLPAVFMLFAMTENLLLAINPIKILYLISAIGLPYGLLLMLMMVMMGSVTVLIELIGHDSSFISFIFQSIVSNYYTIVIFHILGYVIFQYQGDLGFSAREDDGSTMVKRPELERLQAHIEIMVKEGRYDKALTLFQQGVKQFPSDTGLLRNCYRFLLATRQQDPMRDFAILYFRSLCDQQQIDQVVPAYKQVLALIPDYRPDNPGDRYWLAKMCFSRGDASSVISLIYGLHKQHPDYSGLANAYELLAEAMLELPQYKDHAEKVLQLVDQLK